MTSLESHYSANDIETRILEGLRAAGLDPDSYLSPEAIGALDHFHTGGMQASLELQQLGNIQKEDRVLDIGAGLAGCARLLAATTGCQVDCIEMSVDYCRGAILLNQLTNLEAQIKVHEGSALELPFADNSFDVVWMQNVGMNISDKPRLYQEIARVLKPGGRFVFQEVAAGSKNASYFPLPWASVPAHNFLITAEAMHNLLHDYGFSQEKFEDVSNHQFSTNVANSTPSAQGQLGLSVFVEDLGEKAGNAKRSLDENMIRYVRGVFRAGK